MCTLSYCNLVPPLQTASMLSAVPSALEECVHSVPDPQHLRTVLQYHTTLGHYDLCGESPLTIAHPFSDKISYYNIFIESGISCIFLYSENMLYFNIRKPFYLQFLYRLFLIKREHASLHNSQIFRRLKHLISVPLSVMNYIYICSHLIFFCLYLLTIKLMGFLFPPQMKVRAFPLPLGTASCPRCPSLSWRRL